MPTSSISFNPPVIAHRGASYFAPENTITAFVEAKEAGANWIEFDVMLSQDGEVVVFHDETLERTTNGTGNVSDHPYRYLRTLDAGSWFNPQFANERIPTFKEVINLIKKLKLSANVEIKSPPGWEEETAKKVLNEIEKYWPEELSPPLISSFSMPILRFIKAFSPNALIAVLIHDWFDQWDVIMEELQCVSLDINHEILTPEKAKVIKSTGRFLLCYTVNDPARALELFSWGVDAVFTDNVNVIMNAI